MIESNQIEIVVDKISLLKIDEIETDIIKYVCACDEEKCRQLKEMRLYYILFSFLLIFIIYCIY